MIDLTSYNNDEIKEIYEEVKRRKKAIDKEEQLELRLKRDEYIGRYFAHNGYKQIVKVIGAPVSIGMRCIVVDFSHDYYIYTSDVDIFKLGWRETNSVEFYEWIDKLKEAFWDLP